MNKPILNFKVFHKLTLANTIAIVIPTSFPHIPCKTRMNICVEFTPNSYSSRVSKPFPLLPVTILLIYTPESQIKSKNKKAELINLS